ncbi:hypothetical protein ACFL6F_02905 [Planctomycetota bacterium]
MNRITIVLVCMLVCVGIWGEEAAPAFKKAPSVSKKGTGYVIRFSVDKETDVEVAILNKAGKVINHLAAGMVGKQAPLPLKPDSLDQVLTWDGKDDTGKPAQNGPFKVRVALGSKPKLKQYLGWHGNCFLAKTVMGMAVGPNRELFVMLSYYFYGQTTMRVFSPDGKYIRTIMPYSHTTPQERTESVGHMMINDERIPIVYNGHSGNVYPLTAGMKKQTIAWHPKGYMIMASAISTMAEHGPPRHLLALHPEGGSPAGVKFVGPRIRKAIGFLGGAGEATSRYVDHIAVDPKGILYFTTSYIKSDRLKRELKDTRQRQAVFRMEWSTPTMGTPWLGIDREPGDDDKHFKDPQGLAFDSKGQLYICDRGNNRVVIVNPETKQRLGQFSVSMPQMIHISPKTNEIYILSKGIKGIREAKEGTLYKFSTWTGEKPKELAKLAGRNITLFTLDAQVTPHRLWVVMDFDRKRQGLFPVDDGQNGFKAGKDITAHNVALDHPMFVTPDPKHEQIIVRERSGGNRWAFYTLDLKTNKYADYTLKGADLVYDRQGNIYVMDGYGQNSVSRYTNDRKPYPYKETGTNKVKAVYRAYGPNLGLRGHCVDVHGNLYVIRSSNYGGPDVFGGRVDVFGPDGKLKRKDFIDGMGYGDCGLGVDARMNVYAGINIKKADQPYPPGFMKHIPVSRWQWWRRGKRENPWHYMYLNPYLFFWGGVVKFGPEGGKLYGISQKPREGQPKPIADIKNAPKDAEPFRSSYLGRDVRLAGAKWYRQGYAIASSSNDGPRPDPGCVCWTSRLAVDDYGRVFSPNTFAFNVKMFDTGGNLLHDIGSYGNADVSDEIRFAWPAFVGADFDGRKVYVSDSVNRRVTEIAIEFAQEKIIPVR